MGTLGEAYIAVKADMRPFTQDLKKQVEREVDQMEKRLHDGVSKGVASSVGEAGKKAGDKLGEDLEEGVKKKFQKNDKKSWFVRVSSALAGALDDGISALPMQAKAAIVGGILLALPFISGALAGATAAGLGAGIAGLGTILAFQYDSVRQKATEVFGGIRVLLSTLAAPFITETLQGLDRIRMAFEDWTPLLNKIFLNGTRFVEPLTRGILGMVDNILKAIAKSSTKLDPFVLELSKGFELIGDAVGYLLETLVNTGEDGQKALRDLLMAAAQLIVVFAQMIAGLTTVYGYVRKIAEAVPYLTSFLGLWVTSTDNATNSTQLFGDELVDLNYQQDANVVATLKQQQAINKLVQAMDDAYNAAYKLIDAEIGYEESVDRLTESLKQNGRTFDIHTKEGRENLRAFEAALKSIHETVMEQLALGKITAEQAKATQDAMTAALYKQTGAAGANAAALHAMFDEAQQFSDIPVGNQAWLDAIQAKAKAAADALASANAQAKALQNSAGLPKGGTRIFSEYADGGIINGPTPAIVGEAGPEVIIPLTKPGRAAQLAQQSGLLSMLGGGAATAVYVFLGNEQLEPYMTKVVARNNQAMGTAMAYGARGL